MSALASGFGRVRSALALDALAAPGRGPLRAGEHARWGRVALVWAGFLAATIGVLAAGVAAGLDPPGSPTHDTPAWPLLSWDWNWYYALAQNGYTPGRVRPEYAFSPGWPLILAGLDAIGSARDLVPFVAVPLLSAAAFAGVAASAPGAADWRAALALACMPGAFAFVLPYPDALTLAASTWGCVVAARGSPLGAGALGALAAVVRPTGFLIALPLALLARRAGARRWWAAAALPLAALAAVHVYFWRHSGHPDAYRDAAHLWEADDPFNQFTNAGRAFTTLLDGHPRGNTVNLVVLAVLLWLLVRLWRMGREYRAWALYVALVLTPPLLSGRLVGMGRYALLGFPLVWAALDGPRWLRRPYGVAAAGAVSALLILTIGEYQP